MHYPFVAAFSLHLFRSTVRLNEHQLVTAVFRVAVFFFRLPGYCNLSELIDFLDCSCKSRETARRLVFFFLLHSDSVAAALEPTKAIRDRIVE